MIISILITILCVSVPSRFYLTWRESKIVKEDAEECRLTDMLSITSDEEIPEKCLELDIKEDESNDIINETM